jgi:parallel beta-helix repeat protein
MNHSFFSSKKVRNSAGRKGREQISYSPLEKRAMLATFSVTNANDSGVGSLREAIQDSNSTFGADLIEFDIAGSRTINLQRALPFLTDAVEIDGWSQPGFSGAPLITLDGGAAGNSNGLVVQASNTTVRGLVVKDFENYGVFVDEISNVRIQGNYIGTNTAGLSADANGLAGIILDDVNGSIIGAESGSNLQEQERNVISGNLNDGVLVVGGANNVIAGNFIGVGADGVTAIPNGDDGVGVFNKGSIPSTNNVIGGDFSGERNIISGNVDDAIVIWSSTDNTISGNYIGLASDGMTEVANGGYGVLVGTGADGLRGDNNAIGGQGNSERNVIAGNGDDAIILWGASGTEITSNYIGVAADGTTIRPNADGITVHVTDEGFGSDSTVIGGDNSLLQNVIGGSERYGVWLNGTGVTNTEIVGNFIGVSDDGATEIGNTLDGVLVWGTVDSTVRDNVISGNLDGIDVGNSAVRTTIQSNFIGTDRFSTVAIPNSDDGIRIRGASTETLVGGLNSGLANVISGNTGFGLHIHDSGTKDNLVQGNWIGTNQTGSDILPNEYGIVIQDAASENTIGGNQQNAGNLISGNLREGVWIGDLGSDSNVVQGNRIGTDDHGTSAFGNDTGIVVVNGAKNNRIGGSANGASNLISGNRRHGVWIGVPGTENNSVEGNLIGISTTGSVALPNEGTGIVLSDGAKNNPIGGEATGAGNLVSGNLEHGIWVGGFETDGNTIQGNLIGTDITGLQPIGNSFDGITFFQAGPHEVGGVNSGQGNVIASNGDDGITIFRGAQGQTVQGNMIGVGLDGVTPLGNSDEGIYIEGGDLQGNPPTIIYVIDRSGSTRDAFDGTPVGDVNNDGDHDSILDAELAGFIEFTERLNSLGFGDIAEIGVTVFSGSASALDMDPVASGTQLATKVGANLDGGELDIVEVLRTVTASGNTSFDAGLQSAIGTFQSLGTANGDGNVIFVSDGEHNGGNFEDEVDTLESMRVNRIALGMGDSSNLDQLSRIDSDAKKVFSSDEFTNSLLAVLGLNPNQSGNNGPVGTNVQVGGTASGAGNIIANNGGDGVYVRNFLATGNSILGNSIHSNGELGIELQNNGVEANDVLDADAGANDLTNYPTLNNASLHADLFCFTGTFAAEPNQSYRIELFGSQQTDSTGHGEGEFFLGFINVATDASGNATYDRTLVVPTTNFDFVTATATVNEPNGNTSEFAATIDVAKFTPGFAITESTSDTVVEELGTTDDFSVVLTAKPRTPVLISVSSEDPGEATVAPTTLTFTTANWNIPQTVTVTGVEDNVIDGDQQSNITVSVDAAQSDDNFDNVLSQTVAVTTIERPMLLDVLVNHGDADRSSVNQLTLDFFGAVDIGSNAFSVIQRSDASEATGVTVDTSFSSQLINGNTRVTISFDSLTRNALGSLVDGNYQLTVNANAITSSSGYMMNEDYVYGDTADETFYAFYGDSDGNRNVNIFDLLKFRQSYLSSDGDEEYTAALDYGGEGSINVFDLLQFRQRYLRTLSFI